MSTFRAAHSCHIRLANGIDHLVLLDNTRQAADELLDFIDAHLSALPCPNSQTPLLLLVELTQPGTPPLAYLSRCYLRLLQQHKPKQLYARIAYVYLGGAVTPLVDSILRLLRSVMHVERAFFHLSNVLRRKHGC